MSKKSELRFDWMKNLAHPGMLLFFYLLLISTFVTVAVYVYAGEQQNLETRKFGDIETKNVTLNGIQKGNQDVVTLSDGDTLTVSGDRSTNFKITPTAAGWEVTLPSKETILSHMPRRENGSGVVYGNLFNLGSDDVTVNLPNGTTVIPSGETGTFTLSGTSSVSLEFLYQDGEVDWYP